MVLKFIKASYSTVKNALTQTGSLIGDKLRLLFKGPVNETLLDKLEEILYEADLGVAYAAELTDQIRQKLKKDPSISGDVLIDDIRKKILHHLKQHTYQENLKTSPHVILIVGVNGNGKTTSLAKLAHFYHQAGKKVILGAADTFRAAASEQLEIWAQRLKIDIVKGNPKSDPSSVVFDTVSAGVSRHADIVLIDTAGRLHTKIPLMQELEKIKRSCKKIIPDAPHETLLVLDATTGQNAVDQAQTFNKFTPITGLILTKLDGTAKGGTLIAIQRKLGIPVKFIGVGEGIEDLQPFDPESFVEALFN